MPHHRFGALEIEVPGTWSDQSVITFAATSDVEPPSDAPRLRRNFVLTRAPYDGSFDVAMLAHSQLRALRAQMPDVELISEGTLEVAGETAFVREVQFPTPDNGLAQQLHVFHIHGAVAYAWVGIGPAGSAFEDTRRELLAIVQSLRIHAAPSS